jgi:PAS domain S-box-containing protein
MVRPSGSRYCEVKLPAFRTPAEPHGGAVLAKRPASAPLITRPASAYSAALGIAALSAVVRAGVERLAPGTAYYLVLLPGVVFTGAWCGTGPAAAGALVALALAWLTPGFAGQAQLPPEAAVAYLAAAAAIIWVTHALHRFAAQAVAAQARLAEVFRQIPGAAAILEAPEGRLLLHSIRSADVLGPMPKQVRTADGLGAYGGVRADGTMMAEDEYPILRALTTGEIVTGEHLRYRQGDNIADLEVYAGPVRTSEGEIVASVGMAFDVTERMTAARLLAASEAQYRTTAERLRAAVEAAALGLWEIDLQSRRMRLDAAMAAMVGLPAAEVEMPLAEFREFVDPEDSPQAQATLEAAILRGGLYADERRVRTVAGETRWLVSRATVLPEVHKMVGVAIDVTERRVREEALREALEARDVLMREADHRIKNSLQLVASLLRLQLSRVSAQETRDALGEAIARVDAVANAHSALQRSPDLRAIAIDGMLADLCDRMGALNPAVRVRCGAESGQTLPADTAVSLGLIASELITNALRHGFPAPAGGEVALTLRHADGWLEMEIADTGCGLPEDAQARQGLGNTVVATLVRQIGATQHVQTAPGHGTRITVRLGVPPA